MENDKISISIDNLIGKTIRWDELNSQNQSTGYDTRISFNNKTDLCTNFSDFGTYTYVQLNDTDCKINFAVPQTAGSTIRYFQFNIQLSFYSEKEFKMTGIKTVNYLSGPNAGNTISISIHGDRHFVKDLYSPDDWTNGSGNNPNNNGSGNNPNNTGSNYDKKDSELIVKFSEINIYAPDRMNKTNIFHCGSYIHARVSGFNNIYETLRYSGVACCIGYSPNVTRETAICIGKPGDLYDPYCNTEVDQINFTKDSFYYRPFSIDGSTITYFAPIEIQVYGRSMKIELIDNNTDTFTFKYDIKKKGNYDVQFMPIYIDGFSLDDIRNISGGSGKIEFKLKRNRNEIKTGENVEVRVIDCDNFNIAYVCEVEF